MNVLVTGAAGFLGKYVVVKLRSENFNVLTTDIVGDCDYIGDLSDELFVKLLPDVDVIVHCAAVQYVTKNKPIFYWKQFFYRNNYLATKNLVSRYENHCDHFIHIGTSMQYHQNQSNAYYESSQMTSQGVYSWSKLLAQEVIDKSAIKSSTILPCIIGGPGREGLFRGFVSSIREFSTAIIPGDGNHKISIVHVEDVANLILRVILTGATGKFNVAASDPMSINEWAHLIGSILGKRSVSVINLPLNPIWILSRLLFFRLLANEQLVMLSMPHVLDTSRAQSLGAVPDKSCKTIIEEITIYLASCDKNHSA